MATSSAAVLPATLVAGASAAGRGGGVMNRCALAGVGAAATGGNALGDAVRGPAGGGSIGIGCLGNAANRGVISLGKLWAVDCGSWRAMWSGSVCVSVNFLPGVVRTEEDGGAGANLTSNSANSRGVW